MTNQFFVVALGIATVLGVALSLAILRAWHWYSRRKQLREVTNGRCS